MIDIFYYYLVTICFVAFVFTLYAVIIRVLHNKLIESEKRLRLKLNEATSYFKGSSDKVPDFMQNAIGDIGIEGIMGELGIDPSIIKNPLVKGLIEKYAPKVLEQLSKGGKVGETGTVQETSLL